MALDARKRQKKAEKRNAKEKAKRKELARRKATDDLGHRLERVAAAPVLHCCTTQDLWDQGIAQVLFSRELLNGQVAFAVFLVDRFCLGVKSAFASIVPKSNYLDRVYEGFANSGDVVALQPAAARKLVEGAVEYAKSFGFPPHADYARARHIFGDIDAAASDREFEFGKDGKPFFIAGPYDSPARCRFIVNTLHEARGGERFDYLVHVPSGSLDELGIAELAAAFEDGDYSEAAEDVIEGSVVSAVDLPAPADRRGDG